MNVENYESLCKYQSQQSNYPLEASMKSGSTQLGSQCCLKFLDSDRGQFIIGIYKYSTI